MDDPLVARVIETLRKGVEDDDQVRGLVEGAASPMLILDRDARIVACNPRADAFLDRDRAAVIGQPFLELVAPGDRARVREAIRTALGSGQAPGDVDAQFTASAHGTAARAALALLPFHTQRHGERVALLARVLETDESLTTHVHRLEAQIVRDQKMTDLGTLLSTVAHELRSPVTYVDNVAELLDRDLAKIARAHPEAARELDAARTRAHEVRDGARRMRDILRELQPLARNRPTRRLPVDLATLVEAAVRTFRATTPVDTKIHLDLQATHPVALDVDEMVRVLLNLLRNASEAMGGKGDITISTRNQEHPPRIRVEDTGPGLPADVEARLFEPFLTTKPEGTGLGLAISRRIVESNGGTLRHERTPAGGAAFVMEFASPVSR